MTPFAVIVDVNSVVCQRAEYILSAKYVVILIIDIYKSMSRAVWKRVDVYIVQGIHRFRYDVREIGGVFVCDLLGSTGHYAGIALACARKSVDGFEVVVDPAEYLLGYFCRQVHGAIIESDAPSSIFGRRHFFGRSGLPRCEHF